jgi:copper(I)-binding protein
MRPLFLSLIMLIAAGVHAADSNNILVTKGYVRGLPPGVANTAAFMTIENLGSEDLVLTGATTPIAESVSIHETMSDNGMVSMAHQMALVIPAKGKAVLESGGLHLMLMGLKGVVPEQEVSLTLEFQSGSDLTISLPVVSVLDE